MKGTIDTPTNNKTAATIDQPPAPQHADGENPPSPPAARIKTTTDPWVYRMVVAFLGITMLFTVAGVVIVLLDGKNPVPDGLIALGAATVGGLAGFLAPSPVQVSS